MYPSAILDLKTFVPSKDYEISKRFYLDLGFQLNWSNEQVAELQIADFRFLLQNFHVEQWAANFMMQLLVEDADFWWQRIGESRLSEKYPGVVAKPPALQPWGLRVLYLTDPAGVLWHIADQRSA